jgi:hypothetical protein
MPVQDSMPMVRIRETALKFWPLSPEDRDEALQACLEHGQREHPEQVDAYDLAVCLVALELTELDRSAGHG